jgi:GT2 family glycosyltransferase
MSLSDFDVSVIIVSYNIEKLIVPCLRSILRNDSNLKTEVFVVDNHSSDSTAKVVTAEFPQVHLIANHQNRGFSRANNQAITHAKGRYLFLLNPDAEVLEDGIVKMISFMDAHHETGILGPRIYNSDLSIQGSARGFPDFSTAFFGRTSIWTRTFPKNPLSRRNVPLLQKEIDQPQNVDWVSGAAMFIRREALDQTGNFSEDYFLFWEDADLCYRMKQAGWLITYFSKASVIHHVGESVKKEQAKSIIEFHRSAYVWYRKYRVKSPWGMMAILASSGLFLRMILKLIAYFLSKPFKEKE